MGLQHHRIARFPELGLILDSKFFEIRSDACEEIYDFDMNFWTGELSLDPVFNESV
jgi:hypothetical protein